MTSTVNLVTQSKANLTNENQTLWEMTWAEKLKYIKELITVEPLLMAYLFAVAICVPSLNALGVEKSCRSNLKYNETVCTALRNSKTKDYPIANKEVEMLWLNMNSYLSPLQNIVPIILVLFMGSYSDRHQIRKPFMIVPLVGELFAIAGCILSAIFLEEWPVQVQGLLQTVLPSLFGGYIMLVMAAFSHIADSSTIEMRTLRIAALQFVLTTILPIGQYLGGILSHNLDYITVFLITFCFLMLGICYCIFFIKEVSQPELESVEKSLLTDLFDPTNAVDTLKVLFKKDKKRDLVFLWSILIIFFIVTGAGTLDTALFIYLRSQFGFTAPEYAYYGATKIIVYSIGIALFVPLFNKVLHLDDITILILTILDRAAKTIFLALAKSSLMVYIGLLVSIISGITNISLRSITTKVVSKNDLGKTQSLFGISESLALSISPVVFNTILGNTLTNFPAAFIFCQAFAYGICFFMAFFFYFRKTTPIQEIEDDQKNEPTIKLKDIQATHM